MGTLTDTILGALRQKCPRCGKGALFKDGWTMDVRDRCDSCGLAFSKNDSADGPAVILIFFLGFLLVPLALIVEARLTPPVWVHIVLWGPLTLLITLGMLRPVKTYIISVLYKRRTREWD